MAPERPFTEANASPTVNQPKSPPPATRIVPVIPLKLTKNIHERPQQDADSASGLVTPVQSEVWETTPQSTTQRDSSISTPPSAPVTPDSSLPAEKSAGADESIDSPLPETSDSVPSAEPAAVSNEPARDETEMSALATSHSPLRESENEVQGNYHTMQFGDMGPYQTYGPPPPFQGNMSFGPNITQSGQVSSVGDMINGLERTSLNDRNTTSGYYAHPDSASSNGPYMMPPNMMNSGFGYVSPPPMYGMPPMHWGYDGSMAVPPYFGSGQYGLAENGQNVSRNPSQQSSNKDFGHPSLHGRDTAKKSLQNGTIRFHLDPYTLQEHIRSSFRHPEHADYTIVFEGEFGGGSTEYVHSLIASQSPYLARIIREDHSQMHPTHEMKISLDNNFLLPYSMTLAIGYLYGNSLPQILPTTNPTIPSSENMHTALQYAAAGQLLEVPDVVRYGYHQAVMNLSLETIETVLSFLKIAANSVSDQLQASPLAIIMQKYIVEPMMDCIIQNLSADFRLDTSLSELIDAPRLPSIHTHLPRGSTANAAALAAIRFGELPHDRNVTNSNLLSRILLSMDTSLLQDLFKHAGLGGRLGWDKAIALMKELVAEREERRIKVQKHTNNARTEREWTFAQLEAMRWQETVVPDKRQPSGFVIQKQHVKPEDLESAPSRK